MKLPTNLEGKKMKRLLGLFAVLSLAMGLAQAQVQAGLGAFAGVVTDSTKAAIPGAKVVLTNAGTGVHRETVTNSAGEFSFTALNVVGGYAITITRDGFQTAHLSNLNDSVGTVTTENVILAVGSEATTVEVQGAAIEQVQTDTASVSQLVDNTIFTQSPLEIRNQNTFVGLVAGAAPDMTTGRGFAVNGARTGTGNFLMDGFDNNDQGLGGGAHGGAVTTLSPDAIQEYRVITSVPNAEYGRAGGFTTDTVMKSGTNHLHGSAFEYNRIQALAQENWFDSEATPHLRDHLVRNQFGGSLGGPIYKNKTYFYGTVELQRQETGSPSSFTGITQAFYNFVQSGGYEAFEEGVAPYNVATPNPNGDGTVNVGYCLQYLGTPCPGAFAKDKLGPVFTANYTATPQEFPFGTYNLTNEPTDLLLGYTTYLPVNIYGTGNITTTQSYNQNRGTLKIDHALTLHDQLGFVYSEDLDNTISNTGGGSSFPGPAELNYGGAQIFGATWTHTFSPNLLNLFKAGYLRHVRNFAAAGPQGTADTLSADAISTGFGKSNGFPQLFTENMFTYEDSVTLTKGRHTFKAGGRYARTRNGSSFYNDVNGTYYYWGSADMLTDANDTLTGEALNPAAYPISFYGGLYAASASLDLTTQLAPNPYRGYRANEVAAYVQDDWKATPRLLLSYGLRWDYFGPPHNFIAGIDSNVYFGTGTSVPTYVNQFAPNVPLLIGESGAAFKCVNVACGTPGTVGYAPASGSSTIWQRDLGNFGPRTGFSFDTFGNGKLVLRGGWGIGYDRLYNNVYENIRFNGPHFVDNTYGYGYGSAGINATLTGQVVQSPFTANVPLEVAGAAPVPRHVNQNLKTASYQQTHFGIETQKKGYVLEVNYINTLGRQLVGIMNANTFEGREACATTAEQAACKAAGVTNFSTARPNPAFGNDNFRTNGFSSNYNAAQVSVRKGYSHGLQILANYTYGKALDQVSDVFDIKGGATGIPTPYNQSHNYGPADFDYRHNASFTVNYVSQSEAHKLLLAGWGVSPILHMTSGGTINVFNSGSSYDPNKSGSTGVQRALYIGQGNPKNAYNHSVSPAGIAGNGTPILNPNLFTNNTTNIFKCPTTINSGLFCDVGGRNSLYGLRQYNLDAGVSKHIALGERFNLTIQAAFFDIDGHVEWSDPVGDVNSPNFGKSLAAGGREGQLSARIDF
jgi:hypothetical protein